MTALLDGRFARGVPIRTFKAPRLLLTRYGVEKKALELWRRAISADGGRRYEADHAVRVFAPKRLLYKLR